MLFATGARPLEIARLEVRDYLSPDGSVRRASELRAEAAITGKPRPLYFTSTRLGDALTAYLGERSEPRLGTTTDSEYCGLDPHSCLFLSPAGLGFAIKPYGEDVQRRYLCRPILESYRKLFRYADLRDVTPLSARHTVAARLYERGADEEQVGLLLGISGRSAVRELFPKRRPAGDVMLADALYCNYFLIAALVAQGVDVLFEQNGSRITDFRRGQSLGKRDHLVR